LIDELIIVVGPRQVKRKEELAGEGHGDADGAVDDASAEVKLQPRKRSAPSAPPPAPAAAGALLRQRLQGKYDVLTGIALDPTRLSSVRQCTRYMPCLAAFRFDHRCTMMLTVVCVMSCAPKGVIG
jgi:hypothetical protein